MENKKKEQQDFIVETPIYIEERLEKNTDKVRKYERGKFLGKGGFAKCYEMKCLDTGRIFAAKMFEKRALNNARSKKKLINEIKLHKKLHHQNIVNFEHFFEDKENVYILLELCSNQTLNEILKRRKRLTEIEVQCYLIQIIKALKYIHSHKIIHRDLKLGNLFVTSKLELKLGDFGLAAKLEYDGQRRRTVCGTPNYIAPEILEKKNGHSFEVDIWSLGIVTYTLLFGRPPFETSDVKLTYKKIKMNSYNFPETIKVHQSAKKLISQILNLDPSKRLTLDGILEHEFFRIYNYIPVLLPISTLACPPCNQYISQFTSEHNFDNYEVLRKTTGVLRSNSLVIVEEEVDSQKINEAMELVDDEELEKKILRVLLNLEEKNEGPFLRRSESLNLNDERVIGKVNQIINTLRSKKGSIQINSSASSPLKSNQFAKNNTLNSFNNNSILQFKNKNEESNTNIVNNNYFINISNLQNMEIKLDESVLKKLDELQVNMNNVSGGNLAPEKINVQNNDIYKQGGITRSNSKIISALKNNPLNLKRLNMNKIFKFYDYVNKFGIIYFIKDTYIGICFNDHTNILKNLKIEKPGIFNYLYVDKEGKNTLKFDSLGFESFINNTQNSRDLVKKFDIFRHILTKYQDEIHDNSEKESKTELFYIKKFVKVSSALMFRLSNKLIQVIFSDQTELILSTESSEFFYKNKEGEEIQDWIGAAMNSENEELIKRIKYTKKLLIHFVKSQKSKKIPK
jgi:serine/threonine protein kinase